ncbi:MAG: toxin-antitoxin system HicB family antitoxin [Chloroflexi bacterium]|nr:toxin-antitoxin system HicB family antitoxin [Chloroflexota bacterium]
MTEQTKRQPNYVLRFGGGLEVPVYGEGDEAEDAALGADADFLNRLERARRDLDEGKGLSADEVDRYFEEHPPRRGGPKPKGATGNVRVRMPPKLHRELVQQAEEQGVSLNALIITYLAREVGYTAARRE